MTSHLNSSTVGKILSILLALITISSIGAFAFNIASPPVTEKFTEFYLLNSEGKASDYPNNLTVGQPSSVIIGIVNREQVTETYTVEVRSNQNKLNELGPFIMKQGETRQEKVTFSLVAAGNDQKVEFLLFVSGQPEVYRSVYIQVNVK